MDEFRDIINKLSNKIAKQKSDCKTEEATKTAFILPFFNALGYDTSDPSVFVPEMPCDISGKYEAVDYCVHKNKKPIIVVECKHWQQKLDNHIGQMKRYFYACEDAHFACLTNGIEYRFYTDLNKPNIMDDEPFLVVNMEKLDDMTLPRLEWFKNDCFDDVLILQNAKEQTMRNRTEAVLHSEFTSPSDSFIAFISKKVLGGRTGSKQERSVLFNIVKEIGQKLIDSANYPPHTHTRNPHTIVSASSNANMCHSGTVNAIEEHSTQTETEKSYNNAINQKQDDIIEVPNSDDVEVAENALQIIRDILKDVVAPNRVSWAIHSRYISFRLDNNFWDILCRLKWSPYTKWISIRQYNSETKKVIQGERYNLEELNDIYKFATGLRDITKETALWPSHAMRE